MDRSNGELAAALAGLGWHVFPCHEKPWEYTDKTTGELVKCEGKEPYTKNGKNEATTDQATIGFWWTRRASALVGVYCEKSGFFAVDLDIKHPPANGIEVWERWTGEHGQVPAISQQTPSGGWHVLFKMPADLKIPNNANQLAPGVDLRSNGYICTGGPYKWAMDPTSYELTEAPAWLLDKIRALTPKQKAQPVSAAAAASSPPPGAGEYWVDRYLAIATPGNRNETGFKLACQLRDSGLSESDALGYMQSYTDQVPGDDYSQAEALASLREAYHTPAREPATLPQPGSNGSHPEPATVRSTPPEPEGPPVEPAQGGRFLVFDALDALDFDEPIDWVVEGLIAPGSVSTFAGAGGTGKTYSMIDLGVALLTEKQWLDFPVKRTRVLIVDEESGTKRLKRRLGRVMRGHFIDRLNPIQSGDISCISLSLLNLRDPAEAILLQATIEDLGAGVVIIDALIDISGGANENAAEEMHQIYQRLRKIAEDTQAAIIVIHHTSKAGDVRGSTAIKGACDLVVLIDKKEHSNFVNFEVIKARDIEPIKFAAVLNFNDVGQTWLSPAAAQKRDQAMSRPQRWVATYLQEHGPSRRSDIIAEPGTCSDRSASDAIYQLVEKNVIYRTNPEAKTGHGVEAIYALVEPEEEE